MKKRMKQLVTSVASVALMASLGLSALAEEKADVTVMVWGNVEQGQSDIDAVLGAYPELGDKMNIEVVSGGEGDTQVAEKIRLSLASNEPIADLIRLNYTQVPEFAEAGVLEDLGDLYDDETWDNLVEAGKVLATYKDQKVAVPNAANAKLYFYRKDIFDECGVDPSTWKTVDDMIAGGKKIQEKYPDYYIYNVSKNLGAEGYDVYMELTAFDANLTDEEGNYTANTDPGVRKAFETIKKITDSGIAMDTNDWTPQWEAGLADGTLCGDLTASWFKSFIPGYCPEGEGKWAACQWPEEIRKGSEAGGSVWVIPVNAEHKEEAKELVKKMRLTEAGAIAAFENPIQTTTPVLKSVFESDIMSGNHWYVVNDGSYWQEEYKAFNSDTFTIFPYDPKATLEQTIINSWSGRYNSDEMSLDDMLNGLQEELEITIGNPYE